MEEKLIHIYNNIHNNFYDYSSVNYKNSRTKIKIICPIHGVFNQLPHSHKKSGCKECGRVKRSNKKNIITKFNIVHNNFYDYSKMNYMNNNTKIKIICPTHGEFEQTPKTHLTSGCNKCYLDSRRISIDEMKFRGSTIHNNFYDYSKVNFNKIMDKIIIICPIHGEFEQIVNNHINNKQGCMDCKIESSKLLYEDFVIKSNKVHNNLYEYPVQSFDYNSNIKIICPKHGIFNQLPNNHLNKKYGCNVCKKSNGEKCIANILEKNNIEYKTEYIFNECKYKKPLRFDFYLPHYNICIEYNGIQHYESVKYFGGIDTLILNKKRDNIKKQFCYKNNINLISISYKEDVEDILQSLFI